MYIKFEKDLEPGLQTQEGLDGPWLSDHVIHGALGCGTWPWLGKLEDAKCGCLLLVLGNDGTLTSTLQTEKLGLRRLNSSFKGEYLVGNNAGMGPKSSRVVNTGQVLACPHRVPAKELPVWEHSLPHLQGTSTAELNSFCMLSFGHFQLSPLRPSSPIH